MAGRTRNDAGGHRRHTDDDRLRAWFAHTADWRCDLVGIGSDTAVRWVLDRDTKRIVWLHLREVEGGPWVLGTVAEEKDFERKLLLDHPEILDCDEFPGITLGEKFPAWAHSMHDLHDDGRWEFVR